MTAQDIRAAIRKRYSDSRRYAVAEEVGLTTGFSHRRLDMMILDCYNSNGFSIDGIEIKVSTADLRRELEFPEKHVAFYDVIDYYTVAAPAGVVEPVMNLLPPKWGILIVNENGTTRFKRKPIALEDKASSSPVPRGFLAAISRAIQSRQPAEQEIRDAYDRGYADAKEKVLAEQERRNWRVNRDAARLEEYDELCRRFRFYGDNVSEAMDEFEAFRKLDLKTTRERLQRTMDQLAALSTALDLTGSPQTPEETPPHQN